MISATVVGAIKTFTYIYLMKPEANLTTNLNKRIRINKQILFIFPIWELRNHDTQEIIPIKNVSNAYLIFYF